MKQNRIICKCRFDVAMMSNTQWLMMCVSEHLPRWYIDVSFRFVPERTSVLGSQMSWGQTGQESPSCLALPALQLMDSARQSATWSLVRQQHDLPLSTQFCV